jgi:thiol-disulfide isomerase/thioredoxin
MQNPIFRHGLAKSLLNARQIALTSFVAVLLVFAASPSQAFSLKDTDNKPQRLSQLKGKWVVVNFWATWCAPCVKEIPEIAEFAKEQGDRTRVIGIALDWDETGKIADDRKKLLAFAKKVSHTYPLVLGDKNTEKTFGKIKGMPTTIVYDPAGKKVWEKTGIVTKELLTRVVNGEKP